MNEEQQDINQQPDQSQAQNQPTETGGINENKDKSKTWMIIAAVLGVLLLVGIVVSAINNSNRKAADKVEDSLNEAQENIQNSLDEAQKQAEEAMEKAKEDMENSSDKESEKDDNDKEDEEAVEPTEEPEEE